MVFTTPYTVRASAGRSLHEFAAGLGIELSPIAQSVGLRTESFQTPGERISLDSFARLLKILETIARDDCIGLRYGAAYQLGDSGNFGFAMLYAPTLREALRIYRDYQRIIADSAFFDVEMGKNRVSIEWRYMGLIEHPEHFVDFRAVLACRLFRRFLGENWHPDEIALLRSPPRSLSLHRRHLGPSVSFGSLLNRISFPAALLDTPGPQGDLRLFNLMAEGCAAEFSTLQEAKNLTVRVTEQIMAVLPTREASLTRTAAALAMGERSLQRRLAELNTTFERLVEETRKDLSDRMLSTTDAPLAEIGFLCGYSSPSAYSRAARGWYGVPPAEFRRRHRRLSA